MQHSLASPHAARGSATARASRYLVATVSGRAIVFGGLLLSAATLSSGGYARFALAYQIGLFGSYLIAGPLAIVGFRLRAQRVGSALARRLVAATAVTTVAAGVAAWVIVPGADLPLALAAGAFGGAASAAAIMMGHAAAEGYSASFFRWNAWGSLLFPLGVAVHPSVTMALASAAAAILAAPLIAARKLFRAESGELGARVGRLPASVFTWSFAYNSAFVVFLTVAAQSLPAAEADRTALALTFVQASLVIPLQYAHVVQPRLVEDLRAATRDTFAQVQSSLSLVFMLLAFVAAGTGAALDLLDWNIFGVMAASIVPLGAGLTGGYSLLLVSPRALAFVAGPLVFLVVLTVLAIPIDENGWWLTASWTIATILGAVSQSLSEAWTHLRGPLARGLGAGAVCLAAGFVHPVLAIVAAGALLVATYGSIARALGHARTAVAIHR